MKRLVLSILFCLPMNCIADATRYQIFDNDHLTYGRNIWISNCEACHGWGVADAPIPMQPEEWRHRVIKPVETLYLHALEGFFGPDDSMMPARGGNPELSDKEVRAAVDYMLELANTYINQTQEK